MEISAYPLARVTVYLIECFVTPFHKYDKASLVLFLFFNCLTKRFFKKRCLFKKMQFLKAVKTLLAFINFKLSFYWLDFMFCYFFYFLNLSYVIRATIFKITKYKYIKSYGQAKLSQMSYTGPLLNQQ